MVVARIALFVGIASFFGLGAWACIGDPEVTAPVDGDGSAEGSSPQGDGQGPGEADGATTPDGSQPVTDAGSGYDAQGVFADLSTTWDTFDLATFDAGAKGYAGAVYDGRYAYLVPQTSGVVGRYDTQASFTTKTSWATYDVAAGVSALADGYAGGAFDGKYVYFAPYAHGGTAAHGVVLRYDTTAAGGLTSAGAWSTFDVSTKNALASAFFGAAFDGRYLYLIPGNYRSVVARYDTMAAFGDAASWTVFDVATTDANAKGFAGAVFDGTHLYLVPYRSSGASGVVARYDTTAAFDAAGSWSTFDVTAVNAGAAGFSGGAFDGRYLFLVPSDKVGAVHGLVARYDTKATFAAAGSWTVFDVSTAVTNARGFRGAAFDGRHLYLVPCGVATTHGLVTRYDTSKPFDNATSWTGFDLAATRPTAKGFQGSWFDGENLGLVPADTSSTAARFEARSPKWLPPRSASFF